MSLFAVEFWTDTDHFSTDWGLNSTSKWPRLNFQPGSQFFDIYTDPFNFLHSYMCPTMISSQLYPIKTICNLISQWRFIHEKNKTNLGNDVYSHVRMLIHILCNLYVLVLLYTRSFLVANIYDAFLLRVKMYGKLKSIP